jgi:hypothetical protein
MSVATRQARARPSREHSRAGIVAAVATTVLERVGGRVLWHAQATGTVIGDQSGVYDEVIAGWYPGAAAFLALASDPELLEGRADRAAGLERAALIRCEAAAEPVLDEP